MAEDNKKPSPTSVGRLFIKKYYERLLQHPETVHKFYQVSRPCSASAVNRARRQTAPPAMQAPGSPVPPRAARTRLGRPTTITTANRCRSYLKSFRTLLLLLLWWSRCYRCCLLLRVCCVLLVLWWAVWGLALLRTSRRSSTARATALRMW